ncbi:uncharacterized protein [Miscanthus floridulus]|uniref:uncharacterized protein n=1 Tax=Miscanthus floridulus TaxID=154761 RepID=UPI0034594A4E
MSVAAVLPDDALWRPWADLPLDLLRDISRRLHATTDYVRFHATCKPWRDTLPPAQCYPAFLPWLLAPPDSTKHRKARCVFSSSKSTRRGTGAATDTSVPDWRWVISLVDGTVISTLTSICSGGLTDPLTESASALGTPLPLPPFSCDQETKWWVDHANGVVSGDGTIFLYLIVPVRCRWYYLWPFNAALLRPGDAAWTMVRKEYHGISSINSCIAHHDGKIVIRNGYLSSSCIETRQVHWWEEWVTDTPLPSEYGKALQSSYLLESRGELLLANVLANHTQGYRHTVGSFVDGLSVSVHVLQQAEGGETQWVKRDGRSLADRVMFLGRPSSFAVDAARFGVSSGGCAYFVMKSELYGGIWSKMAIKQCRVFKYSFQDDRSEFVEQLPAEWDDDACMWVTPPQPSIASTEEIRERLEPSHTKAAGGPRFGPYFRIYVGNLPRNVDSYRLGQFFSKYGKVAEARVMYHIKTKRSRGFGFVTMATLVDHEQEQAIAKLNGQILDGRPVRVKLADQKQPHVCSLLV